ncbi:uncharacterized protein LOC135366559 [Ornithodoros turicata]|uniref:uncharacterized protein LOC135366559 n=1 Tax=Ornithodoros turicata TaxID=34597 RepID=UPI003138A32F
MLPTTYGTFTYCMKTQLSGLLFADWHSLFRPLRRACYTLHLFGPSCFLRRTCIFPTCPTKTTLLSSPRQLALDHLNSVHGQRKAIFTDGSVVYGASSAAFYMSHSDTAQAFKLPHETSSTEAELTAIYEALNAICGSQADSWSIFTDSKSALETLASYWCSALWDLRTLVIARYNELLASGHSVRLQWVPSHVALPRADIAAKRAHTTAALRLSILLSMSACLLQIHRLRSRCVQDFIERAISPNTFLHSIDPKMQCVPTPNVTRRKASVIHRVRLSVARTPTRLFQLNTLDTPTCAACSTEGNTSHLLLHCRLFAAPRATLMERLAALGLREVSLATLLGPLQRPFQWRVGRELVRFLTDTGLALIL